MTKWMHIESYHLFRNHDNCLDRESSVAVIKKIFQAWSEEVNDQDVVESFLAKVIDIWYAGCKCQCSSEWERLETHGSRPKSCRFGIHLVIAVRRFSVVPDKI